MNEAIKSIMRNRIQSEPGDDGPDSPPRRVFTLSALGAAFGTSILAACGVNRSREQVVRETAEGMSSAVAEFEKGDVGGRVSLLRYSMSTARDPALHEPPITAKEIGQQLHESLRQYAWYGKANNGYIEVMEPTIISQTETHTGKTFWAFQVKVRDTRPPPRANGLSA